LKIGYRVYFRDGELTADLWPVQAGDQISEGP
jgi:hypothetical protein